jgi:Holliday junction resolvase
MTPEGRIKVQIKRVLDELGIWYFMPAANGFGKVGIPDFICCWQGEFLAIEAKAPGKMGTLTPNQMRRIEEIRSAGGTAYVVDDPEYLRRSLTGVVHG